jgi:hypothetical protein
VSNDSVEPNVSIQAEVQPNRAHVGDVVTLRVTSRHPAGLALTPPAGTSFGNFEVHASTRETVGPSGQAAMERFVYELQSFTTGQQLLPGLTFTYPDAKGHTQSLKTPEFKVAIELVPPGPKDQAGDIRGIKGVLGPVGISPWWWLLVVFALAVVGAALWRDRRRKTQGPPPEPAIPPDQSALQKLQDLLAAGLLEQGKIKEFYSGLSDIVRGYIEAAWKCPALERTTGELMRDLRRLNRLSSDQALQLRQLLEDCDLVKFAKFRPEEGEALKAHALAVQIVRSGAYEGLAKGGTA